MLKRFYIIGLILLAHVGSGQDLHFSQFNENPSLVNPALTGAFGPIRASVTNRDQWRSVANPYKTIGATFETRFKADTWKEVEGKSKTFKESVSRFATGISFYNDRAGNGYLGLNQINLSMATFVPLNKMNFISVGLQGSFAQRKLNNSELLFSNQYNGTTYDPNQSSLENYKKLSFSYFDAGAGVVWSFSREEKNLNANKQFKSHFGFSTFHLIQPGQEYLSVMSKLYVKYVAHGDLIASLGSSNMALSPSFLVQMQGPQKEILIGTMLRHYLNTSSKYTGLVKRNCFGYGLYYRSQDAVSISVLLEWQETLAIIFNYDINTSALSTASSFRGGAEITLRYTAPKSFLYQRK